MTIYKGKRLPPFYVGSSNVKSISEGYHGSVSSKKWKHIYDQEILEHPELFSTTILRTTKTRKMATAVELYVQKANDVVKSNFFFNEAFAKKNGMFGRDVSGKNNGNYGRRGSNKPAKQSDKRKSFSDTVIVKDKNDKVYRISKTDPKYVSGELKAICKGKVNVKDKNGKKFQVSVDDKRYISGELKATIKDLKKKKCPHCGKETDPLNAGRWHFDKCKMKQ